MAASSIASIRSCSRLPCWRSMSSPRSAEPGERRRVAVLGSTGSIGTQTLDVLATHPDAFQLVAIAAGHDAAGLEAQRLRHRPLAAVLAGDDPSPLVELATRDDVDLVVV